MGFTDSLKKAWIYKRNRFQITDDEIDRFIQSDGNILIIDTRIITISLLNVVFQMAIHIGSFFKSKTRPGHN